MFGLPPHVFINLSVGPLWDIQKNFVDMDLQVYAVEDYTQKYSMDFSSIDFTTPVEIDE